MQGFHTFLLSLEEEGGVDMIAVGLKAPLLRFNLVAGIYNLQLSKNDL
jgi:hypothetical protein